MTAITHYSSLEGIGKWRSDALSVPMGVAVVLGKRSLMIQDIVAPDRLIAHWDLAAITRRRADPEWGVCYSTGPTRDEELWISADQTDLIAALDTLEDVLRPPETPHQRPWGRIIGLALGACVMGYAVWTAPSWKTTLLQDSLTLPMRQSITQGLISDLIEQGALCSLPQNDTLLAELNTSFGHDAAVYIDQRTAQRAKFLSRTALLLPRDAFESTNEQEARAVLPQLAAQDDPLANAMIKLDFIQALRFWLSGHLTHDAKADVLDHITAAPQISTQTTTKKITGALYERLLSKCFSNTD